MIGLSWDIYDSRELQTVEQAAGDSVATETRSDVQHRHLAIKYRAIDPSIKDIVCFAFCYLGSLTGREDHYLLFVFFRHNLYIVNFS
jgi:hypothetical protein